MTREKDRNGKAEHYKVSLSFVAQLLMRRRQSGGITAKPYRGGKVSCVDKADRNKLREWLAEQTDLTLSELVEQLEPLA